MAIRTNTLVQDFEYVSQFDEAVDKSAEDFEHKWKIYRDGMGEPPLVAGSSPTRFKLRHVTSVERIYLLEIAQGDEHGLYIAAAAMSLVGAKGAADEAGKPYEVKFETSTAGPLKIRHATKASLDALPVEVLLELGSLAMERATARPSS